MADQQRPSKAERREAARAERKAKEAEAARRARRERLTTWLTTVVILAVVVGGLWLAFAPSQEAAAREISSEEATAAREAAGCEIVSEDELASREHLDPATAPPADVLYTGVRPTNSGPHYNQTHPLVFHGADDQLDERATTHNLEHGSVIAWYDPEQVDGGAVDEMEDWSEGLNENGFSVRNAGTGIFVSPYTDPGISSGKAVAFRAWGMAMDCDEWDRLVADAFVVENYGSHGEGPERNFAPYPEDQLSFSDREVGDTSQSEAPLEPESPGATGTTVPSAEPSEPTGSPSP